MYSPAIAVDEIVSNLRLQVGAAREFYGPPYPSHWSKAPFRNCVGPKQSLKSHKQGGACRSSYHTGAESATSGCLFATSLWLFLLISCDTMSHINVMNERAIIVMARKIEKKGSLHTQRYPRLDGSDLLDDSALKPHTHNITGEELRKIILRSIEIADRKASRAILNLADDATDEEVQKIHQKEGWELFRYFKKYCGDPAATAAQCLNKPYQNIAREQFRNRTLQKERMNSAWRYQYIAKDAALASKRFNDVSDRGLAEADFVVVVDYTSTERQTSPDLTIYVSVKNRSNTMGGQDWPKAIVALENEATYDKNRAGDFLCVFGITIERGERYIKRRKKTNQVYSVNTEIWLADYFWPFFTNFTYQDIVSAVLQILLDIQKHKSLSEPEPPIELIESFGECCAYYGLVDENGCFFDAFRLADFFCSNKPVKRPPKKKTRQR